MAMSSILVVDDEPHICELLHSYFTDHGHKVYVAETGQEALAINDEYSPDIMLLDFKLPGMSGLDILHELQQKPHMPIVIILSGHSTYELAEEAIEAGAFDYITKPLDLKQLAEIISIAELTT
ncbi:response regulator [candidate division KSB1 bacterium]|nr:response regulator [candidate division KSB1 bacterium]